MAIASKHTRPIVYSTQYLQLIERRFGFIPVKTRMVLWVKHRFMLHPTVLRSVDCIDTFNSFSIIWNHALRDNIIVTFITNDYGDTRTIEINRCPFLRHKEITISVKTM